VNENGQSAAGPARLVERGTKNDDASAGRFPASQPASQPTDRADGVGCQESSTRAEDPHSSQLCSMGLDYLRPALATLSVRAERITSGPRGIPV